MSRYSGPNPNESSQRKLVVAPNRIVRSLWFRMKLVLQVYGECGILVRGFGDSVRMRLLELLEHRRPDGCVEFVGGYDSVLFLYEDQASPGSLREWLERCDLSGKTMDAGRGVRTIPVVYDGVDLEDVARQAGMPVSEVIERHTAPVYTVRMMGFAPGFPYLDGLDPALQLPRKASPRDRIEPGSVAIGGPHAGIYSVASPGGWHLLGQTQVKLFNPDAARSATIRAEEVFLLLPGDRLRFQAVE